MHIHGIPHGIYMRIYGLDIDFYLVSGTYILDDVTCLLCLDKLATVENLDLYFRCLKDKNISRWSGLRHFKCLWLCTGVCIIGGCNIWRARSGRPIFQSGPVDLDLGIIYGRITRIRLAHGMCSYGPGEDIVGSVRLKTNVSLDTYA